MFIPPDNRAIYMKANDRQFLGCCSFVNILQNEIWAFFEVWNCRGGLCAIITSNHYVTPWKVVFFHKLDWIVQLAFVTGPGIANIVSPSAKFNINSPPGEKYLLPRVLPRLVLIGSLRCSSLWLALVLVSRHPTENRHIEVVQDLTLL